MCPHACGCKRRQIMTHNRPRSAAGGGAERKPAGEGGAQGQRRDSGPICRGAPPNPRALSKARVGAADGAARPAAPRRCGGKERYTRTAAGPTWKSDSLYTLYRSCRNRGRTAAAAAVRSRPRRRPAPGVWGLFAAVLTAAAPSPAQSLPTRRSWPSGRRYTRARCARPPARNQTGRHLSALR